MRPRGFTLIEILVVLVLAGILTAAIGLSLTRRDGDRLRDEAERLGLLLRAARNEAILGGRPLWIRLESGGYRFLGLSADGRLVELDDDMFRTRVLDAGIRLSQHSAAEGGDREEPADLVFLPSGEAIDARMTLRLGALRHTVALHRSGEVEIGGGE